MRLNGTDFTGWKRLEFEGVEGLNGYSYNVDYLIFITVSGDFSNIGRTKSGSPSFKHLKVTS